MYFKLGNAILVVFLGTLPKLVHAVARILLILLIFPKSEELCFIQLVALLLFLLFPDLLPGLGRASKRVMERTCDDEAM